MSNLTRRQFLATIGASTLLATLTPLRTAQAAAPHVVIVGGGFAGATAAKYLRKWSNGGVAVTLIEPNATYYSCILSNLILNGQRSLAQLALNYAQLQQSYGVTVVAQRVEGVESTHHTVTLTDGSVLGYDRLILAPGVEFLPVEGLDSQKIPHAWKAGAQSTLLQQQIAAIPDHGTFVMTIPAAPYRCPPGPYERACLVADYLKRNRTGAKVVVLDANSAITAEKETFSHAFSVTYGDSLTYVPNAELLSVDSDRKIAFTRAGEYRADVLNVIPPQSGGSLLQSAGVMNVNGRWAGVNPLSYESTAVAGIHIIGDAQGTGQPKSGHIANSEAKVCADAIIRLLQGGQPFAAPMTNSACYSPISADTASWLTAVFGYDAASRTMKLVNESLGESATPNNQNYRQMFDWASNLFADSFS